MNKGREKEQESLPVEELKQSAEFVFPYRRGIESLKLQEQLKASDYSKRTTLASWD